MDTCMEYTILPWRGWNQRPLRCPLCPSWNTLCAHFMECGNNQDQGILYIPSSHSGSDDRRLLFARFLPFLHLLGSNAHPHVLDYRCVGGAKEGLRGSEIFPLYPRGKCSDACRHHCPLSEGGRTFDLVALMNQHYPYALQFWLFWAFFAAFAVKVPMFPFHTWLPDAHTE